MHPALREKIELIKEKQILESKIQANDFAIQAAVALGEINLVDGKHSAGPLTMTEVRRTSYRYSPAVAALQEQEKFQGIADERISTHFRYKIASDDND